MDLSPGQQKAVFAVIVIALAALGYYLVVPALHHTPAQAQAAATPTATPSQPPPAPTVTTSPAAATTSSAAKTWTRSGSTAPGRTRA